MATRAEESEIASMLTTVRDLLLKVREFNGYKYDRELESAIRSIDKLLKDSLLVLWDEKCLIVTNDIGE